MLKVKTGPVLSAVIAGAWMSAVLNAGPSNPVTLVKEQRPASTIVVGKNLPAAQSYAAQELQKYLGKISGAQVPIREEGEAVPGCKILLGTFESNRSIKALQNQLKEVESLGEDGFLITTMDGNLVIAGGGTGGVLYGVYTFLEKYLGCRWYFPGEAGEVIPKGGTIELEAVHHSEQPSLSLRCLCIGGASGEGLIWMARNKMNALLVHYRGISMPFYEEMRSKAVTPHMMLHSFWWLIPDGEYYDKHPEYFPLINGKRVRPDANDPNSINVQLCLSNPDVLAICVEKTRTFFATYPEIKMMGICPNDGRPGWCECAQCKAMGKTQTDRLMTFVNRVAAEIHKSNPDKYIGYLAYADFSTFSTVKPLDNVMVEYVNNSPCENHTLDDPKCEENAIAAREMEGWVKVLKPSRFIWGNYNPLDNGVLLPAADVWARNIKWFHDQGMAGFQVCVTPGSLDMLKLNSYVTAKVGWDVSLKYEDILDDFCKNLYGPAAGPMKKYYLALDRALQESPGCFHRGDPSDTGRVLTSQVLRELNGYVLEAQRLTAASSDAAPRAGEGDTAYADRVARESAQLEKWTDLLERRREAKQVAMAREVPVLPAIKPLPSDADLSLWERQGQPVTNFIELTDEVLAHEQTFCWVRYDQDNLYVAFKCHEPHPDKLARCPIAHNGPVWQADDVEVFIDPDNSKNNYSQLQSDSAGNTADVNGSENPSKLDYVERPVPWKVRTSLGKDCWYAEITIPLKEVGLTPRKGTSFGISLNRSRYAGGPVEFSGWPNGKFCKPEQFGTASFE